MNTEIISWAAPALKVMAGILAFAVVVGGIIYGVTSYDPGKKMQFTPERIAKVCKPDGVNKIAKTSDDKLLITCKDGRVGQLISGYQKEDKIHDQPAVKTK